jgi:hypothetical protein
MLSFNNFMEHIFTSWLIFPNAAAASFSEENLRKLYPLDFPDRGWHIILTVTHNHQFRGQDQTPKITRTNGFHYASLRAISFVRTDLKLESVDQTAGH